MTTLTIASVPEKMSSLLLSRMFNENHMQTEQLIRPAESAHWYTKDGQPLYEIENKSKPGTFRPTTLRDARKLSLVPSVTSVLSIMARPGLEAWKQSQIVLAALTLPRNEGESIDDFAMRVINDAAEHGKQAADLGTQIHAAVQGAFEDKAVPVEYGTFVSATMAKMNHEWPIAWECEKPFSHPLGFGGKVDAYSPGNRIVIDWKTTRFSKEKLPTGYDEHLIQLSAYAFGLGIENAEIANVYISTSDPGLVHIVKWSKADRNRGLEMFLHIMELWKLSKGYNPARS